MKQSFFLTILILAIGAKSFAQAKIIRMATETFDKSLIDYSTDRFGTSDISEAYSEEVRKTLDQGIDLFYNGEFEAALEALDESIELSPDCSVCLYYRALCLRQLEDVDAAQFDLINALEIAPESIEARNELAVIYINRNELDSARQQLNKALDYSSTNPFSYYHIGLIEYYESRNQKAIRQFKKALSADPQFVPAYFMIGMTQFARGGYKAAMKSFNQAIADATYAIAYWGRGLCSIIKKDEARTYADWEKAAQLEPDDVMFVNFCGMAHILQKEYKLAMDNLIRAVRLDPADREDYRGGNTQKSQQIDLEYAINYYAERRAEMSAEVVDLLSKGLCLFYVDEFEEALATFDEAILTGEDLGVLYFLRGMSFEYERQFLSAKNDYTKAIEIDENIFDAHKKRGLIRQEDGEIDLAFEDFTAMTRIDSTSKLGYKYRGILQMQKKDLGDAIADFSQVNLLDPEDADALYNRGACYAILKQYEESNEDMTAVIALRSNDVGAYHQRALNRYLQGDLLKALVDCDSSLAYCSRFCLGTLNLRGRISIELGDYETAITFLSRAINPNRPYPQALFNRGIAYYGLKKYKEALRDVELALEAFPQDLILYFYRARIKNKMKISTACLDLNKAVEYGMQVDPKEYQLICNKSK